MTSNDLQISPRSFFLPGITPGYHMSMHAKNWVPKPYRLPVIEKCHVCDGQTDKQTDIQTDRQTNRQTHRQTDRQPYTQTDSQPDRQTDRQTDTQTDRNTYRLTDTQAENRDEVFYP